MAKQFSSGPANRGGRKFETENSPLPGGPTLEARRQDKMVVLPSANLLGDALHRASFAPGAGDERQSTLISPEVAEPVG
jgi:hypothetical protein